MKNLFGFFAVGFVLLASDTYFTQSTASDTGEAQQLNNKVQVLEGYRLKYSVETTAKQSTIWHLWSDVENWKKFDTLLEYSYLDEGYQFELGATGAVKADGASKTRFKLIELTSGVSFTERLFVPLYQSIDLKRYFEESDQGNTIFTHEVVFKGRLRFLVYRIAARSFKTELPLVMGRLRDVAEALERDSAR